MGHAYDAPARRPVVAATALAATAVAVGSDVVAGEHPEHSLTLAAVGVLVMVLRLRLAGRHRGLFAALTAAFLAQPVLHATMTVLPVTAEHGHDAVGTSAHLVSAASVTGLHLVVAATIVAAVASAEHLFVAVVVRAPLGRWLRCFDVVPPPPPSWVAAPTQSASRTYRWAHVAHVPRRGPPAAATAV